jgi:hypothetical protein
LQAEIEERTEAEADVRKQASLLDLEPERRGEVRGGGRREEAVGRVSYESLQTVFPVSIAKTEAELYRTGPMVAQGNSSMPLASQGNVARIRMITPISPGSLHSR